MEFDPHAALAKRCYRPLSHLSGWAWTVDIYSLRTAESKAANLISTIANSFLDSTSREAGGHGISVDVIQNGFAFVCRLT